jgi:Fanconi anemia group M protein
MKREEKKIIIYVDKRELSCRIASILEKYCDVEERQLHVADYLLSDRVAVERKTCSDFVSSIVDGRLFKQMSELKSNFEHPVLIIEGDDLFSHGRDIHPNAIRGALASIATDYCVPIIWTANQLETANMLFVIAKREQLDVKKSVSIRGKKKARSDNEAQEIIVSGLPKISIIKARNLLKHFKTPEKVFTAKEDKLKEVGGIGDELAKQIRKILTKKYEKSILED